MILNRLKLQNIGSYFGDENEFELNTNGKTNAILIGGKNGSGKTTFLEAIKLALFGSYTYGYSTDNEVYLIKIKELLNRNAIDLNYENFLISLDFTAVENFTPIRYTFIRNWTITKKRVREQFTVLRNEIELSESESDHIQNRIREEFPPKLFELCLLDGEEISRVVSTGQIPQYLSEIARVLFNLDLFNNLEKDLLLYKQQKTKTQNTSSDEILQLETQYKINKLQEEYSNHNLVLHDHENEMSKLKDRQSILKSDFEKHGGLAKEQREKIIQEVTQIENERKHISDTIKEFLLNSLPIFLTRSLLQKVDLQMENEREIEFYDKLKTKISPETLLSISNSTSSAQKLYHDLIGLMRPNEQTMIHRASFSQQSRIRQLNDDIQKTKVSSIIEQFDSNQKLLEELQDKRKKLDLHDRTSEFSSMLEELESITQTIEQTRIHIEQIELKLLDIKDELSKLSLDLIKVNERLNEVEKSENTFVIADRLLRVSERFRAMQLRKKLDLVERQAIVLLDKIFRKKGYITQLRIDHESFEVSVFRKNRELAKERLSAGEKEILMISIIWAMFKTTGWRLPLVFDTLLGRLDNTHKKELITQFIPSCGEQVIILATDSEITADQWNLIKPSIYSCYTLDFNLEDERTVIINNQFFEHNFHALELI